MWFVETGLSTSELSFMLSLLYYHWSKTWYTINVLIRGYIVWLLCFINTKAATREMKYMHIKAVNFKGGTCKSFTWATEAWTPNEHLNKSLFSQTNCDKMKSISNTTLVSAYYKQMVACYINQATYSTLQIIWLVIILSY